MVKTFAQNSKSSGRLLVINQYGPELGCKMCLIVSECFRGSFFLCSCLRADRPIQQVAHRPDLVLCKISLFPTKLERRDTNILLSGKLWAKQIRFKIKQINKLHFKPYMTPRHKQDSSLEGPCKTLVFNVWDPRVHGENPQLHRENMWTPLLWAVRWHRVVAAAHLLMFSVSPQLSACYCVLSLSLLIYKYLPDYESEGFEQRGSNRNIYSISAF